MRRAKPATAAETPSPRGWNRRVAAGVFVGWWTVFALLFANMFYFMEKTRGREANWGHALLAGFFDMYMWGLVSLGAISLAWYLPLRRDRLGRLLLLHLAAGVTLVLLRLATEQALAARLDWWQVPFSTRVVVQGTSHLMVYFPLVGVGYAISYFRRYRDRELSAARLEAQLSNAQLQALKMQLHPHFLFNTLNAISALMHRDVRAADRMLARLGDLLRMTLDAAATQEVPLQQELRFLETYLEIEQTRFGERLAVRMQVEPELLEALVPHLLLQPLVENAIKHGVAPRAVPGSIAISARREGARLRLEVVDNGPGLAAVAPARGGVGLANTRARLQRLYGAEQRLELCNGEAGGLCVRVELPLRLLPANAPPEPGVMAHAGADR